MGREGAAQLESHKVALLGLGVENRVLGQFLHERGVQFAVCDARSEVVTGQDAWHASVSAWHLGPDYYEYLENYELIFRTPGISILHPHLRRARVGGSQISSQTKLFFELSPAPILGVTGTKGKGTTSALITEILQEGLYPRVFLGGNIGLPPIGFLDQLRRDDLVVLELSSFQLQDLDRSPYLAVVLNVTEDHLDYHVDRDEYIAAKQPICAHQQEGDVVIYNCDCPQSRQLAAASVAPRRLAFSVCQEVEAGVWCDGDALYWRSAPAAAALRLCAVEEVRLPGKHNLENVAAAVAAAAAVGATSAQIVAGIRHFKGLAHRLEDVGTRDGVRYYNDSLATTPEAAVAAIQAFDDPVILIAGGSSKGADFAALGRAVVERQVRAVILLGEEAARIEVAIVRAGTYAGEIVRGCADMVAAVAAARSRARSGDVVLLSPGCASFGLFADYKDRGRQFKRLALE